MSTQNRTSIDLRTAAFMVSQPFTLTDVLPVKKTGKYGEYVSGYELQVTDKKGRFYSILCSKNETAPYQAQALLLESPSHTAYIYLSLTPEMKVILSTAKEPERAGVE